MTGAKKRKDEYIYIYILLACTYYVNFGCQNKQRLLK